MARRTLQIAAAVAAVTLVGTVGLTVAAAGDASGSGEQEGGFLSHLHKMVGRHMHHGGHHQGHMGDLIEQMGLTPDQQQSIERIHQAISTFAGQGHTSTAERASGSRSRPRPRSLIAAGGGPL